MIHYHTMLDKVEDIREALLVAGLTPSGFMNGKPLFDDEVDQEFVDGVVMAALCGGPAPLPEKKVDAPVTKPRGRRKK